MARVILRVDSRVLIRALYSLSVAATSSPALVVLHASLPPHASEPGATGSPR